MELKPQARPRPYQRSSVRCLGTGRAKSAIIVLPSCASIKCGSIADSVFWTYFSNQDQQVMDVGYAGCSGGRVCRMHVVQASSQHPQPEADEHSHEVLNLQITHTMSTSACETPPPGFNDQETPPRQTPAISTGTDEQCALPHDNVSDITPDDQADKNEGGTSNSKTQNNGKKKENLLCPQMQAQKLTPLAFLRLEVLAKTP